MMSLTESLRKFQFNPVNIAKITLKLPHLWHLKARDVLFKNI